MLIFFNVFILLVIILAIIFIRNKYEYVQETKRVWKGFEKNYDSPLGVSNVYHDVKVNTLRKKVKDKK